MKILAVDYGKKYIGLAVSDEMELVATTLPYFQTKTEQDKLKKITALIKTINPRLIVLGLPQRGQIYDEVQKFGKQIKESSNTDILYWNEDYTSKQAEQGRSIKFKKGKSHSESARIILQEYLDSELHQDLISKKIRKP